MSKPTQDTPVSSEPAQVTPQSQPEESNTEPQGEDLKSLPLRAYLDKTVVPLLLLGLAETAKERPDNPVEFLANFLLQNNPQVKQE
ncbi:Dpy-30 domain-containing protein [Blastocystis sp. subtype 4]|uniref:Dpy-30 domain-containing protein n=1 Tax=Blastocystis sp. subtype 4 TaxID=944170 RepID=UPI00071128D0|nr:Dpy-30 domain-containing protein [Blastocystis sp. subtype 4]KNB46838.1 Dpy-30 domain-containing protein [Blastocystis sp. subtype 4]|eukprot:XP_014530281.1 Dpy-30 domain-containing protein [Blastocystis sp. subtype 4]